MLTDPYKAVSCQFSFARVHLYFVKRLSTITQSLISLLFGIIGGVVVVVVVGIWIAEGLLVANRLYLTQLDYKVLNYLTFRSSFIVIHSFNLRFFSTNHVENIPIDPSWLDMTKKPIFGLTRLQSNWWDSLHLTRLAPFILWFTPLDMIPSIYILIHSLNLDKSRFDYRDCLLYTSPSPRD